MIELLAAAMTAVAAPDSLSIRFIGNAAFELADGRTTLVTDFPYVPGAYGYMTYDFDEMRPDGRPIAVITHRHTDHVGVDHLQELGWRVFGPDEVTARVMASQRIPRTDSLRVGAFVVIPSPTNHGNTEHYSYVIEWRGRRLYFSGDTENPSHLLRSGPLDVAFLTPWLMCELSRRRAAAPAELIVVHHQYAPPLEPTCLDHRRLEQGQSMTFPARSVR